MHALLEAYPRHFSEHSTALDNMRAVARVGSTLVGFVTHTPCLGVQGCHCAQVPVLLSRVFPAPHGRRRAKSCRSHGPACSHEPPAAVCRCHVDSRCWQAVRSWARLESFNSSCGCCVPASTAKPSDACRAHCTDHSRRLWQRRHFAHWMYRRVQSLCYIFTLNCRSGKSSLCAQ